MPFAFRTLTTLAIRFEKYLVCNIETAFKPSKELDHGYPDSTIIRFGIDSNELAIQQL
jgi:hypothetical protein